MKYSKFRFTKLMAIILVLVMILCSCGKDDEAAGEKTNSGEVSSNTGSTMAFAPDSSESGKGDSVGGGTVGSLSGVTAGGSSAGDSSGATAGSSSAGDSSGVTAGSSSAGSAYDASTGSFSEELIIDADMGPASAIASDKLAGESSAWEEPAYETEGGEDIFVKPSFYQPGAHMLSAAEWNDNRNFDFLKELIKNGQETNYKSFFDGWGMTPLKRVVVSCNAAGKPALNAVVVIKNANGEALCATKTDAAGKAYCYYDLDNKEQIPAIAEVSYNGENQSVELSNIISTSGDDAAAEVSFSKQAWVQKKLELMYMVDTTGSMGDELEFLKVEVADVIKRVREKNGNIPVSLSVNFYRDVEDDYVVRSNEFSEDIDAQVALLMKEYASGGGDYEEAVEQALENAVAGHQWSEDSIKVMFLILDAPPHNTAAVRETLAKYLPLAAEKGIRIVPVAASGVDKSTEFLLRIFAMVSGGTYCFLTNDSGIGGGHIEATVGDHVVEYLDDLMVRVLGNYISGEYTEASPDDAFPTATITPAIDPAVDYEPVIEDLFVPYDELMRDDTLPLQPVYEPDVLLVLTDKSVMPESMKVLFDEMGADMENYTEWDDSYYYDIRFRESKSEEELLKAIEVLEEKPFVTDAEFNHYYSIN